jgi:hypothetical protein
MATGKMSRLAIGALAALAVAGAGPALAQRSGGGGGFHGGGGGAHAAGGFHGGGGGFHSGGAFHGGGFHGGGALHGGAPGFHGAGGVRGGSYGGWHGSGGYGRGGYYGGAGLLGYGLFFAALPLAYATYYWDGAPYYYADDNYYQWVDSAGEYETVTPPAGLVNEVTSAPPADAAPSDGQPDLFAYPQTGQSATQQAKDRTDCQQWATGQVGADATKHDDYLRAEAACLTGKGYSVR